MTKVNHSHIIVLNDRDVCINTEEHGVYFFNMDEMDTKGDKKLEMQDLHKI